MLNSVCHLFTLDDLVRHLAAVRANLVDGGVYIVELAHPADFFAAVPRTSSEWTIDAPGVHADVHWGGRTDQIDPLTQVTQRAHDHHRDLRRRHDPHGQRRGTQPVLDPHGVRRRDRPVERPARWHGPLGTVATYGDFDETTTLEAASAWRMILVLRRA